jgi:hypothetical protein
LLLRREDVGEGEGGLENHFVGRVEWEKVVLGVKEN